VTEFVVASKICKFVPSATDSDYYGKICFFHILDLLLNVLRFLYRVVGVQASYLAYAKSIEIGYTRI